MPTCNTVTYFDLKLIKIPVLINKILEKHEIIYTTVCAISVKIFSLSCL